MTTPDPRTLSTADAVLVLGAVSAYAKAAAAAEKEARERILGWLPQGSRMPITDPRTKAKLGTVTITDPKAVAEVFDEEAFLDYVAETETDATYVEAGIKVAVIADVYAVLREHAPHLLHEVVVAHGWARKAVLDRAAAGEAVPGVEVRTKPGHAAVGAADGALEKYRELVAAGRVDPLLELPAATVEHGEVA